MKRWGEKGISGEVHRNRKPVCEKVWERGFGAEVEILLILLLGFVTLETIVNNDYKLK